MQTEAHVKQPRTRSGVWLILTVLVSLSAVVSADAHARDLRFLDSPIPAPALRLPSLDGTIHDLANHQGQPVILHFWASWCRPCVKEMPALQEAWEPLNQANVQILAVAVGDSNQNVRAFLAEVPVDFPMLLDTDQLAYADWPLLVMPTTFVIDGAGQIVATIVGPYEWDDSEQLRRLPVPFPAAETSREPL